VLAIEGEKLKEISDAKIDIGNQITQYLDATGLSAVELCVITYITVQIINLAWCVAKEIKRLK
jgi:hypothetical protein